LKAKLNEISDLRLLIEREPITTAHQVACARVSIVSWRWSMIITEN